jgi:hypothetical protein
MAFNLLSSTHVLMLKVIQVCILSHSSLEFWGAHTRLQANGYKGLARNGIEFDTRPAPVFICTT